MSYNYDIPFIESFNVDSDGNLIVVAIIENMGKCTTHQTLYAVPEFAPARCKTKIYPEYLPANLSFIGKTEDELEELVNRHNLLIDKEWEHIGSDDDYYYGEDDYCSSDRQSYF